MGFKPGKNQVERPDSQTKFNMDISYQQRIDEHMGKCASLAPLDDVGMRYKGLKEAEIMLAPGFELLSLALKEEREEYHRNTRDALQQKITRLNFVMTKYGFRFQYGMLFNIESKDFPKKIDRLMTSIAEDLDEWEREIRKDMKTIGLLFIAGKSNLDATDN